VAGEFATAFAGRILRGRRIARAALFPVLRAQHEGASSLRLSLQAQDKEDDGG